MEFKRILCPVDFSDPSRTAMASAVSLAKTFGAEVALFHAYELPVLPAPEGGYIPSPGTLDEIAKHVQHALDAWKKEAEASGVKVTTSHAVGPAHLQIVRLVEEGKFDLVVMGTHGRTGLAHLFLGSIAERVVQRSPCPVLTIRPPKR